MKNMKFICGLAQKEEEYVINGVKYIVGSSFQSAKISSNPSIADRFKRIIQNDAAPLTVESTQSKMTADNVCLGCTTSADVRKED